jgi:hypothetical protein
LRNAVEHRVGDAQIADVLATLEAEIKVRHAARVTTI